MTVHNGNDGSVTSDDALARLMPLLLGESSLLKSEKVTTRILTEKSK